MLGEGGRRSALSMTSPTVHRIPSTAYAKASCQLLLTKKHLFNTLAQRGNAMGRRTEVSLLDNQVRSRRQATGLNQQALATRCGLTRQAISAIEAGQYIPNTAVALRLARVLNCTVEELFRFPAAPSQVEVELLGEMAAAGSERMRLLLARVGERLLAHPLTGPMAVSTAADGLTAGTAPDQRLSTRRGVTVDLLVDAQVLEHTVVVLGCDPALG